MIALLLQVRDLPRSLDEVGPWFGALDGEDARLALLGLVAVCVLGALVLGLLAAIVRATR